jgi:hypothetical protein
MHKYHMSIGTLSLCTYHMYISVDTWSRGAIIHCQFWDRVGPVSIHYLKSYTPQQTQYPNALVLVLESSVASYNKVPWAGNIGCPNTENDADGRSFRRSNRHPILPVQAPSQFPVAATTHSFIITIIIHTVTHGNESQHTDCGSKMQ